MRFPVLIAVLMLACPSVSGAAAESSPVQMLVPGFTVRELPLRLSNINTLRFAPDGRLFALGYDGRIHILRDTDGDGLEDASELFWSEPTITVPVGMALATEGVYVSSHGKVSLLRDTNGDGKADREEIIASGWPAADVKSGGVDATAVTLDRDGNVYFALITANYANPYRVKDGVSHYDLKNPRGTIQKLARGSKIPETVATGVRVPFALAFNKAGDLFCTDQEGETWCPDGNPLDELNHIVPGRNYGFPPRHDKWLPQLVSEPPVVGFGPQHQSACGLVFNEPHNSQGLFGPDWWEGDAFVAGQSRGKIWRVRMVKTSSGYVGKEFLIARLAMLATDLAISPGGAMYVACHSGQPDWGTGPKGEGKIFRITYTDAQAPQPVIAFAPDATEVRVAFDRPVDPSLLGQLGRIDIEFGEFVRAADRFEKLKPPYKVVKEQQAAPRGRLNIVSASLEHENRTLVLSTDPHPQAVHYALTLPGVKAPGASGPGEIVDLAYDLSGAWVRSGKTPFNQDLARLRGKAPGPDESFGWAASANRAVAEALVAPIGSKLAKPDGAFSLLFRLNLPLKGVLVHARASAPVEIIQFHSATASRIYQPSERDENGRFVTRAPMNPHEPGLPAPGTICVFVKDAADDLELSYSYVGEGVERAFTPGQLVAPWFAGELQHELRVVPTPIKDESLALEGGDYERGRALFFSDKLQCATCHRIRGEGALIGPDLSNLVSRDAASVLRDIREPSATINPDYVGYHVTLRDETELTGFLRAQDEKLLRLVGADGSEHALQRADVKELRPSAVSLMPAGLIDQLKDGQVRDLLTFVLHAPPTRSPEEVEKVMGTSRPPGPREPRELLIVLVASKQDHGPGQHDYPAWQKRWNPWLAQAEKVTVQDAWLWPTTEQFARADLLVFYYWNREWSAEKFRQLEEFITRGGGVVAIHSATIGNPDPEPLAECIGLASRSGQTKYLHAPFDLTIVATNHPIVTGLARQIRFLDEPYWPMIGDTNKIEVLATTQMEGRAWPMLWTFQKGKGRVFASIPGHYTWTLDDPLFRTLVLRGMAWAAGEDSGRWENLVLAEFDAR